MSHTNVPHHQCHSIHYFCATAISKKDLSSTGHCWYSQTSLETLRHLTSSFIFNSRRLIHTVWSRVKVNLGFFLKKIPKHSFWTAQCSLWYRDISFAVLQLKIRNIVMQKTPLHLYIYTHTHRGRTHGIAFQTWIKGKKRTEKSC